MSPLRDEQEKLSQAPEPSERKEEGRGQTEPTTTLDTIRLAAHFTPSPHLAPVLLQPSNLLN